MRKNRNYIDLQTKTTKEEQVARAIVSLKRAESYILKSGEMGLYLLVKNASDKTVEFFEVNKK